MFIEPCPYLPGVTISSTFGHRRQKSYFILNSTALPGKREDAMARFIKNRKASMGLHPGSLVFIGKKKVEEHIITVFRYDASTMVEKNLDHISESREYLHDEGVTWINIDGIHGVDVVRDTGKLFNLHPLLLEDILNTGQRPKLEEFDNCLFLFLKMIRYDESTNKILSEQLSLVLSEHLLLTFQEEPGDVLDPVRERIRNQTGKIRSAGADYLAYSLLDTVVDNHIAIIEIIGEKIEDLEEEILMNPSQAVIGKINGFKREMNYLRKSIRPARDMVLQLLHAENPLIKETTLPFLKDLADLFTQAVEAVEIYRDMLSDMMHLFNTIMNNKMNDIMKVLTIFSAIFIPLTLIAGVYGTNFKYFPELRYKYSYYIFLAVLFTIGFSMLAYFKRKKWF